MNKMFEIDKSEGGYMIFYDNSVYTIHNADEVITSYREWDFRDNQLYAKKTSCYVQDGWHKWDGDRECEIIKSINDYVSTLLLEDK